MIEVILLTHDFRSVLGAKSDVCYGTRAMSDNVLGKKEARDGEIA